MHIFPSEILTTSQSVPCSAFFKKIDTLLFTLKPDSKLVLYHLFWEPSFNIMQGEINSQLCLVYENRKKKKKTLAKNRNWRKKNGDLTG